MFYQLFSLPSNLANVVEDQFYHWWRVLTIKYIMQGPFSIQTYWMKLNDDVNAKEVLNIVVTYSQFDSNIRVLYVFLGFLKNTWKYLKILDHRCLWVWAQLKLSLLSVLFIVFTYFTYSHFQILKYLKILLF